MQTDSKTSYLFLLVELMEKYGKFEMHKSKNQYNLIYAYLHAQVQHSGKFYLSLDFGSFSVVSVQTTTLFLC